MIFKVICFLLPRLWHAYNHSTLRTLAKRYLEPWAARTLRQGLSIFSTSMEDCRINPFRRFKGVTRHVWQKSATFCLNLNKPSEDHLQYFKNITMTQSATL